MSIGVYIPARTKSNRLPNKLLLPFGKSNLFDLACEKISKLPEKYGRYALICEQELIDIANKHNLPILLRDKKLSIWTTLLELQWAQSNRLRKII